MTFNYRKYDVVNKEGQHLSVEEEQILHEFMNVLQDKSMTLNFRGDSRLPDINCCENQDINELCHRIFLIGPKGKHFWEEESHYVSKTITKKLMQQVFNCFHKVFTMNIDSADLRNHVLLFEQNNNEFVIFFRNSNNKDKMWNLMRDLKDRGKERILDYYLAVLHSIGQIAIHGSPMLSTSIDVEVAKNYAHNGCIIISWIDNSLINQSCFDLNGKCDFVRNLGLPISRSGVFPEQKEICVKYGILPHRVLGIIHSNNLIINPNMFNGKRSVVEMAEKGFWIDQTEFDKEIKLTKYKRCFSVIGDDILIRQSD